MGMRPVSSHIVPENGGFLGIFAGLYAVYEKFAGKLRDGDKKSSLTFA